MPPQKMEDVHYRNDRWALRALVIAGLIAIALLLASLVVTYWGDEYATPAWDEHSVPAPRTY